MTNNIFDFIGSNQGTWKVLSMKAIKGESLPIVSHISSVQSTLSKPSQGIWTLKGVTSNVRYAEQHEREKLNAIQPDLGRPHAICAAMIPLRKTEAWWTLAQDERRKIFENKSHHTEIGLNYLPAIARKLFHCRDIGGEFDFITWFEYAPEDAQAFEELVARLRATEEWTYVDRDLDIRLIME